LTWQNGFKVHHLVARESARRVELTATNHCLNPSTTRVTTKPNNADVGGDGNPCFEPAIFFTQINRKLVLHRIYIRKDNL
jgi:hypothetical protein